MTPSKEALQAASGIVGCIALRGVHAVRSTDIADIIDTVFAEHRERERWQLHQVYCTLRAVEKFMTGTSDMFSNRDPDAVLSRVRHAMESLEAYQERPHEPVA